MKESSDFELWATLINVFSISGLGRARGSETVQKITSTHSLQHTSASFIQLATPFTSGLMSWLSLIIGAGLPLVPNASSQ